MANSQIQLADLGMTVEFPDTMTTEDVNAAITKIYQQSQTTQTQTQPSTSEPLNTADDIQAGLASGAKFYTDVANAPYRFGEEHPVLTGLAAVANPVMLPYVFGSGKQTLQSAQKSLGDIEQRNKREGFVPSVVSGGISGISQIPAYMLATTAGTALAPFTGGASIPASWGGLAGAQTYGAGGSAPEVALNAANAAVMGKIGQMLGPMKFAPRVGGNALLNGLATIISQKLPQLWGAPSQPINWSDVAANSTIGAGMSLKGQKLPEQSAITTQRSEGVPPLQGPPRPITTLPTYNPEQVTPRIFKPRGEPQAATMPMEPFKRTVVSGAGQPLPEVLPVQRFSAKPTDKGIVSYQMPEVIKQASKVKEAGPNSFNFGGKVISADELTPAQRKTASWRIESKAEEKPDNIPNMITRQIVSRESVLKRLGEPGARIYDALNYSRNYAKDLAGKWKTDVAEPILKLKSFENVADALNGKFSGTLTPDERAAFVATRRMLDEVKVLAQKEVPEFAPIEENYFPRMPKPEFWDWLKNNPKDWMEAIKQENPNLSDAQIGDKLNRILNNRDIVEAGNLVNKRRDLLPEKFARKDAEVVADYIDSVADYIAEKKYLGDNYSNITAELPNLGANAAKWINEMVTDLANESRRSGKDWKTSNRIRKFLALTTYTPVSGYIGNGLSFLNTMFAPGVTPGTWVKGMADVLFKGTETTKETQKLGILDPFGGLPSGMKKDAGNMGKKSSWYMRNIAGFRTEDFNIKTSTAVGKRVVKNLFENWKTTNDPKMKSIYEQTLDFYGINPHKGSLTAADINRGTRGFVDRMQNIYNDVISLPESMAGSPMKRTMFSGVGSATRSSQLAYRVMRDLAKYRTGGAFGIALAMLAVSQLTGAAKSGVYDAIRGGPDKPRGVIKTLLRNQSLGVSGGQYADVINAATSGQGGAAAILRAGGLPLNFAADVADVAGTLANTDASKETKMKSVVNFGLRKTPVLNTIAPRVVKNMPKHQRESKSRRSSARPRRPSRR